MDGLQTRSRRSSEQNEGARETAFFLVRPLFLPESRACNYGADSQALPSSIEQQLCCCSEQGRKEGTVRRRRLQQQMLSDTPLDEL